mmetsp:Transcript_7922/g.29572  ORF Transcript_7922/g.29572 Transcript_7922/m.29572 type:complete len:150 (+) Transcript_7922:1224-1673(+)
MLILSFWPSCFILDCTSHIIIGVLQWIISRRTEFPSHSPALIMQICISIGCGWQSVKSPTGPARILSDPFSLIRNLQIRIKFTLAIGSGSQSILVKNHFMNGLQIHSVTWQSDWFAQSLQGVPRSLQSSISLNCLLPLIHQPSADRQAL